MPKVLCEDAVPIEVPLRRLRMKVHYQFPYTKRRLGYYEKPSQIRKRKRQRQYLNSSTMHPDLSDHQCEQRRVRRFNRNISVGIALQFTRTDFIQQLYRHKVKDPRRQAKLFKTILI